MQITGQEPLDSLLTEQRELRDRLAAALWRNRQLQRKVSDLQTALRVVQGQLADVEDIKQRMELWTGEL